MTATTPTPSIPTVSAERPTLVLHTLVLDFDQMVAIVGNVWGDSILLDNATNWRSSSSQSRAVTRREQLIERLKGTDLTVRTFPGDPALMPRIESRMVVDKVVFWLRYFAKHKITLNLETPFPTWIKKALPPLLAYYGQSFDN